MKAELRLELIEERDRRPARHADQQRDADRVAVRHGRVLAAVDDDRVGVAGGVTRTAARGEGEAAALRLEICGRDAGDMREIWGRGRGRRAAPGDMGEIWGRYGGDMGERERPPRCACAALAKPVSAR